MSDADEIAAIRARVAAVPTAPWRRCGAQGGRCDCGLVWSVPADSVVAHVIGTDEDGSSWDPEVVAAHTDLIAHAPDDLAALLAALDALERERADLRADLSLVSAARDAALEGRDRRAPLEAEHRALVADYDQAVWELGEAAGRVVEAARAVLAYEGADAARFYADWDALGVAVAAWDAAQEGAR